jgi:hypothetical protein
MNTLDRRHLINYFYSDMVHNFNKLYHTNQLLTIDEVDNKADDVLNHVSFTSNHNKQDNKPIVMGLFGFMYGEE